MTCETTRDWILQADSASASSEIDRHIRGCADCQKFVRDVMNLERQWRDRPLPERAGTAKAAFLIRLQNRPTPVVEPLKPHRWAGIRYVVAAALLFVVVGSGFLFFGPGQQAAAQSDVIDQLIDWNLDLSEAASPVDRQRIFADKHEKLKRVLGSAKLDSADRQLAEHLLANGTWLAQNEDLGEELQRFNSMADELLERVKNAAESDRLRSDRYAKQFRKVNERGIDPAMDRLASIKNADPERRKLINRILKHDKDRAKQIDEILEKSPDITKKELGEALEVARKRGKHKK